MLQKKHAECCCSLIISIDGKLIFSELTRGSNPLLAILHIILKNRTCTMKSVTVKVFGVQLLIVIALSMSIHEDQLDYVVSNDN